MNAILSDCGGLIKSRSGGSRIRTYVGVIILSFRFDIQHGWRNRSNLSPAIFMAMVVRDQEATLRMLLDDLVRINEAPLDLAKHNVADGIAVLSLEGEQGAASGSATSIGHSISSCLGRWFAVLAANGGIYSCF